MLGVSRHVCVRDLGEKFFSFIARSYCFSLIPFGTKEENSSSSAVG